MPLLAHGRVDAFADDDRVVDDDAEHEDEAEQADHVDRHRPRVQRHQPQRAEERDRDADDDPQRELQPQEQRQHDEHQRRALREVAQHQFEPLFEVDGTIEPGVHLHARRQRRPDVGHVVLDDLGGLQLVLGAAGEHVHRDDRLALVEADAVVLDEAVGDRGDVAQAQARAIGKGADDHIAECLAGVELALRAQQDVAAMLIS